jgi:hypothetical protein
MQKWFFASSAYGGCRYYRQVLPIRNLSKEMRAIGVSMKLSQNLAHALDADVIFFSRNIGAENTPFVIRMKEAGKLIVWDMDDDLSIPARWLQFEQNPQWVKREILALDLCLDLADFITVSTRHLGKSTGRPAKTSVCGNAIDVINDWKWMWRPTHQTRDARILYAGTPTHAMDLELVRPLYKETCLDYEWVFFGCKPEWIGANATFIPLTSVRDYPRICRMVHPRYCLAPLSPNDFNLSKSPIKVWEMATTGAVVVASDFGPYEGRPSATVPAGEPFAIKHLSDAFDIKRHADVARDAYGNSWGVESSAATDWTNTFRTIAGFVAGRRGETHDNPPLDEVINVAEAS